MTKTVDNLSAVEQKELLVGLLAQRTRRVYPLSLAQQRLWFLDRLYPGNPAYNVPFGLRLQGKLDRDALKSSLLRVIERHGILRTCFETDAGGRPVQVVAPNSEIEISFVDLTTIALSDLHAEVYRIGLEEVRTSFNLQTGPLLRPKLIRLAAEEHLFFCVMHHIVCDRWSLDIFVREVATLYNQCSGGSFASLAELPIQYGDYAQWQQEGIAGHRLAEQVRYWKQKLAGAPALLDLPSDHARPPEQTYDGASQVIPIPRELIQNLTDFGRTRRATLFMVMLAAFKTLIHCYTRSKDILVGIPVAGRNRLELEDLIGFFVNTLVLRTDLSGDPHFADLLLRVRETTLDAFAHADLPFERLVEELNPQRSLSYGPVIQVMFSAIRAGKYPDFGEVSASPYIFNSCTSVFDLSVEFIEDAESRWWLRVEYDTSLFDYKRMTGLLNDYLMLLRTVATQPELRISRLASLLRLKDDMTSRNGHFLRDQAANLTSLSPREREDIHSKDKTEPRDALEQILVRIWERVLNIRGIVIRDNFFDLGGHSLLAAHLVSEVEKVTGRKVPLSALFRGSTIESLANVIRHQTEWSPDLLVMELNRGTQGFPLFAIVQSGVDALGYALLSRHMGAHQPLYKIQAHAPVCHIVPFSIEELRAIAREYVAAMRVIQPKGPYFLIGMCNGVHIGEQMVLQLEEHGHQVGFFGIIDTFVMQNSWIRWLVRFDSFRRGRKSVARLPLLAQISHYKQAIQNRLRHIDLSEEPLPAPWAQALWPGPGFQFKQFRAPVILFRRPKQPYFKIRAPGMGWAARSLSGVKICTINVVEHMDMLREPAVQMIGAHLSNALYCFEKSDRIHRPVEETAPVPA